MSTQIKKPVVALKVGSSKRGAKAAASHTGSLAGSDRVYDGAFKQKGILRADSFTEAFGWARTLTLPNLKGKDTVIITNGGGIGVRTTDECDLHEIPLLDDPQWLEEKFRPSMPDFGSTKNPIDITGATGEDGYRLAVHTALAEDRINCVIILYCQTAVTDPREIASVIMKEYEESGRIKPIVVAMVGGEETREALHLLNAAGIPGFTSVTEAVSGLKALFTWHNYTHRKPCDLRIGYPPQLVEEKIAAIKKEGRHILLEHEAREILELCGVPTPRWAFARNLEETLEKAKGLYPLAMKVASLDIVHKTEMAGVMLNIHNEEELAVKYKNMMEHIKNVKPDANILGVNLVEMVKGIECIVGMSQDQQFGPVVMFGLGGIFVEMLKDVAFRVVPFCTREAELLIEDIKGRRILDGFRGRKAHKMSIIQTILAVQRLAPLVQELDINPLISNDDGSYAVDARIVI